MDIFNFTINNIFTLLFIFLIAITMCKNSSKIGCATKLIDYPEKGRVNKRNTPLVGGVILYICLVIFCLIQFRNISFLTWVSGFFIIGILDDLKKIRYLQKALLSILFIVCFLALDPNLLINKVYTQFGSVNVKYNNIIFFPFFFSTLCVLLLQNAINMMDGHNGLCIYSFCIYFMSMTLFIPMLDFLLNILLCLIFILCILFSYNMRGKLFLGDSGNFTLSAVASYCLMTSNNALVNLDSALIFLIFIFPGLDMLRLFIFRVCNKKNPLKHDLNHFHHLLNKHLKNEVATSVIYFSIITAPLVFLYFFPNYAALIILVNIIFYVFIVSILIRKRKLL
jgi:UDP-GlcNAc:undecaprenyl-phosphate/decaprenyl-phosphate GlcNAc-1-phosphate transferase